MSEASACLQSPAGSAPANLAAPYSPFHAVPLYRMAAVLGLTASTVGFLSLAPAPGIALHRWARAVLRCLGLEIRIKGELLKEPRLWVSNHLSWLDPLVLLSLRPMGALAKCEVAQYPLIGRASRKTGLTFVDRMDALSRASAVVRLTAELRGAKPMLLFPEGTTTLGHGLAPLQEGGLRAAFRCGTAVQTMRISCEDPRYHWIGEDTLLPHLMKIVQASATPVLLEAGEMLEPWQFEHEGQWIEAIRRQLTPTR